MNKLKFDNSEEVLRASFFETVGHFKIKTNSRIYHAKFFDEDGKDFYIVKLFNNRYKRIRKNTVVCFSVLLGLSLPEDVEINEHLSVNSMMFCNDGIDSLKNCSTTIIIDDNTEIEHIVFKNKDEYDDYKEELIETIYND